VASRELERDKTPTLFLVFPWFCKLKEHCEERSDFNELELLKSRAMTYLIEKFPDEMFYKVGMFLNPKFRRLRMLPEEERENVYGYVSNAISNSIGQEAPQVPNKKKKLDFNEWADYSENSVENELNLYRHQSLSENVDENLLNWWKNHSSTFPSLARLAKQILSIPASSASSERNFSTAGSVITERRTRLSPNNVDAILFIHGCKS